MINTIIFDIGNVLAYFCWREVYREIFNDEEYEIAQAITVNSLDSWNLIDKGVMDFDDFFEIVCENHPEYKSKIKNAVIEIFNRISPFDYAEEFVRHYKEKGYKVYILSNYGELPFLLSRERFSFLSYTDGGIISYEVKMIKPEKEIYHTLMKRYNIDPCQAVFIDDNEHNIISARELGINSIHFTDYKKAREELDNLLSQ